MLSSRPLPCVVVAALSVCAALAACDANPYHAVGCTTTHALGPQPGGAPEKGVVCVASDSANDAPLCDKVAAVYRAKEHPPLEFGVVVRRRSLDAPDCKVHYAFDGRVIGELSNGE